MEGWVSINRKLCEHWLWDDRPFSRGQAWIDLIMMVNHKDAKIIIDGTVMQVNRGSTVTSIRKLTERWGWSNTKVTKFLAELEINEMVTKKSDTKKTVLTVMNYSKYQNPEKEKTTQKHHGNDTEAIQKHTNNNDNNVLNNEEQPARAGDSPMAKWEGVPWDEIPKEERAKILRR